MHDVLLTKFICSIGGAVASSGAIALADVQNVLPQSWVEGGAATLLIGCLVTAVVTLWKRNNQLHRDIKLIKDADIKERQEREARVNKTNQELLEAIRNLGGNK